MASIFKRLFKRERVPAASWDVRSQGAAVPSAGQSAPPPHLSSRSLPPQSSLDASSFDAVYARATASAAAQDFASAIPLYERAIALEPGRAEPYYKLANALKNTGRLAAALASYDQALERKPDYGHAYCNRGVVQQALGLGEAALASYDRAIALNGTDVMAHYNRAILMQESSRWTEALASYDRAVDIDPQFADAQYNRSMAQLFLGDFESGWRGYEWRWTHARRLGIGEERAFAAPRWLGRDSIDGKRILLHAEAGLGDTLQFCRYATECVRLGATVILEVQAPLRGLLESLEGVSAVLSAGSTLPPFDYHCPLLSLPLAFKTTLPTIPAPARYLRADEARIAHWRTQLGERRRPRVGLVWSGNPGNPIDARRSIRLADWLARLPPEFEYFRLQTQVREADLAALESSRMVVSLDDALPDFENTAALCECMDVIVTVDTSLAHLSGALGHRTWVLLAHTPDFRWLQDRDDSPWYPSVSLYRQQVAGDWSGVFGRVAADLRRQLG
jgi:Tfp pilus assembly protein PilF